MAIPAPPVLVSSQTQGLVLSQTPGLVRAPQTPVLVGSPPAPVAARERISCEQWRPARFRSRVGRNGCAGQRRNDGIANSVELHAGQRHCVGPILLLGLEESREILRRSEFWLQAELGHALFQFGCRQNLVQ